MDAKIKVNISAVGFGNNAHGLNQYNNKDNKDNSNTDANLKKNRSNILFVQRNKIIGLII